MARIGTMRNGESVRDADAVLRLFLTTTDPTDSEYLMESLLTEFAQPQIRRIARHRLSFLGSSEHQDVDDIVAEVISELLRRLREMKRGNPDEAIKSFPAYTAAATYRAYNDYLRRKYPQRHQLKAQLRYVLNANERFALWEDSRWGWLCGYRKWLGWEPSKLPEGRDLPESSVSAAPAEVLASFFELAGGPLKFDELVGSLAEIKGLGEWCGEPVQLDDIPSRATGLEVLDRLENRQWLARLWTEISALPLAQRKALLLNLRSAEGDSALALVPIAGIASIPQIARLLDMETEALASLWNQLPIDDMAIASKMGMARQQVINLRKSARERLARRMASA